VHDDDDVVTRIMAGKVKARGLGATVELSALGGRLHRTSRRLTISNTCSIIDG
jgi:hypothetical protein